MEEKERTVISYDYDKLLQRILDIGEEMIVAGAEVNRVEDSIYRMCEAYGADRINVFIITSNIQVTLESPDGKIITHIRRIVRYSVNFDRLDYLNDLSRWICASKPDDRELKKRFYEVLDRPKQKRIVKYLAAVMVAGGFTVFFGGRWGDAAAAALMGIVIVAFEHLIDGRETNLLAYNFIVSVVAGLFALAMVHIGLGQNADKIMIGGIMLLIPGIAMTNAVRDMLIGDIASGLLRLVDALLIAGAIACGFALAIFVLGGFL